MKYVKVLMLALLAVGAVSAVGASGASAVLPLFECEAYPCLADAAVTGGVFEVNGTEVKCTSGLFKSEEQSAPSEILLMLAAYGNCKAFGIASANVNMKGCDYVFHTDGTVDIGPAGCGPITITALECIVTVSAQSGLKAVEYVNKVEGGKMVVEVRAKVVKIVYNSNHKGIGCPANGGEASYTENTTAKGISGGAQTGILVLA